MAFPQVPVIIASTCAGVMAPRGGATSASARETTAAPGQGHCDLTHDEPNGECVMIRLHQAWLAAGTRAVLNVHVHPCCQIQAPWVPLGPSSW
eukprot:7268171-Pyramimonas_sp.AAC.1